MRTWRHSGFHAFAGNEIPDVDDAVRVGLYMMRSPAATSRSFGIGFLHGRSSNIRYLRESRGY